MSRTGPDFSWGQLPCSRRWASAQARICMCLAVVLRLALRLSPGPSNEGPIPGPGDHNGGRERPTMGSISARFRRAARAWRVRSVLLTSLASGLGGAAVPFVAGSVGGGGFGAYLAIGLSIWFACLVAYFRPKSAILFVVVLTATAAAVYSLGRKDVGLRGGGVLTVV